MKTQRQLVLFLWCSIALFSCNQNSSTTQNTTNNPPILNNTAQHSTALAYLNQLRAAAGLSLFTANTILDTAAANHANYLVANNTSGHEESSGFSGFTGQWAADRAVKAGYKAKQSISENVSTHSSVTSYKRSIDVLMSAIYHRLGFLTLTHNEIGIGYDSGSTDAYVYNLGNSLTESLCTNSSGVIPLGTTYYSDVCADSTLHIEAAAYDATTTNLQSQNPQVVLWPADGSSDIPPAFYEESPDPLPNHSVSGYPISVQFNEYFFANPPQINQFVLRSLPDNQLVSTIAFTNPGGLIGSYEAVLFPAQRLEWNHQYRAELEYDNGTVQTINWSFTTSNPGDVVHTITSDTAISVSSGVPFIIYTPPINELDGTGAYNISRSTTMNYQIEMIDNHTLKITLSGSGSFTLNFHGKSISTTL